MQQVAQHRRRAGAWAREIAIAAGWSPAESQQIADMASAYEVMLPLSDQSCQRLATDLRIEILGGCDQDLGARFRSILDATEMLNEQLEFAPYGGDDTRETISELMDDYPLVAKLRRAGHGDLMRIVPTLPVYPAVALRTLQTMSDPDVSVSAVEKVAACDQVLAGKLISVANSAHFAHQERIGTIGRAINQIGLENARRIVTAEAMRPVFQSKRTDALWRHAVASAKAAERIADLSNRANMAEAFLAGLVHDIGRLAISLLPTAALESYDRVLSGGCEQLFAEIVLFGFDHAEAGGEILNSWKFPPVIAEAVRHHHSPDLHDDVLASVLYMAEFWTESDEEPPSAVKLRRAEQLTGVTLADLATAHLGRRTFVDELAGVA